MTILRDKMDSFVWLMGFVLCFVGLVCFGLIGLCRLFWGDYGGEGDVVEDICVLCNFRAGVCFSVFCFLCSVFCSCVLYP